MPEITSYGDQGVPQSNDVIPDVDVNDPTMSSQGTNKKMTVAELAQEILQNAALTGTPTTPTASPGTNTTQVASTSFVKNAVPALPISIANGGTGQTSAPAAYSALSPMTTLGDIEYEGGSGVAVRLPGNTSTAREFLRQQGNGTISAVPAWDQVRAADVVSLPWVTVSAVGIANGGSTITNGGANFGPDTPGTTTSGIQEAFNSLPTCTVYDAFNNQFTGNTGCIRLLGGVFTTSGPIIIGPGVYRFTGAGTSQWSEVFNITSPTQNLGGTAIVGSDYTHPVVSVPLATSGYPVTVLWMDGIEVRLTSPSAVQTSSAPSLLSVPGWEFGEISNVTVIEVATTGGIANHMYIMADFGGGAPTNGNAVILRNIRGYGGHTGVRIDRTHCHATNISGGSTGNSIDANATGILISQELGGIFHNLHTFSTKYGLTIHPYTPATGQPRVPMVINNVHFEAVTHYINTLTTNCQGTLFLDQPTWDETSPVPATDIAAQLTAQSSSPNAATLAGFAIITSREINDKNIASGWHVAPAPVSLTAGATPYTFPQWPYDVLLVMTSLGDMSALTLDGQALFNGTFSIGQMISVRAGHTLVATYTSTAPVFQVIPQ